METSERVFADSNYFVALFYPHDALHHQATIHANSIAKDNLHIITSSFVFLETVTVLSQRAGRAVSREAGLYLRNNPFVTLLHIDEALGEKAWRIFQNTQDKNISFVDCSTIAVMQAEHITTLLTFDVTDFRKLRREYKFIFLHDA